MKKRHHFIFAFKKGEAYVFDYVIKQFLLWGNRKNPDVYYIMSTENHAHDMRLHIAKTESLQGYDKVAIHSY